MAIDFPSSPSTNDTYTYGDRTWSFDGTSWVGVNNLTSKTSFSLGSQATPSIKFIGDDNTGIYSPGADQIGITTGGTERVKVDSSGNVGIGTSSADGILHVKGANTHGSVIIEAGGTSGTTNQMFLQGHNNAGTAIGEIAFDETAANQGGISFKTNGGSLTTKMTLTSGGSLGVGTTSPGRALEVGTSAPAIKFNNGTNAWTIGTGAFVDGSDSFILFEEGIGERLRVDNSGRLLVGTSSARTNFINTSGISAAFQVEGTGFNESAASIIRNSASANAPYFILGKTRSGSVGGTTVVQNGDPLGVLSFQGIDGSEFVEGAHIKAEVDGTPGADDMPGRLVFSTTADGASSPTERMRINNFGRILIGGAISYDPWSAQGNVDAGQYFGAGNNFGAAINSLNIPLILNRTNTTGTIHEFKYNGQVTGWIHTTSTAISINYSSDYRLKENVIPLADAITRVKQLQPKRFNYIIDPDVTLDGFLAHEAQTVIPEAVVGTHNQVDDNGDPVYQGIDPSKMIPLLTAALQEAIAKIETLEAKVAALEGGA